MQNGLKAYLLNVLEGLLDIRITVSQWALERIGSKGGCEIGTALNAGGNAATGYPETPSKFWEPEAIDNTSTAIEPFPETITGDEYVRWAYRLLLGREPESPAVVKNNPFKNNRELLVQSILGSEEYRRHHQPINTHPITSWEQAALAFIHIPKTGGTTLHSLLSACFSETQICPERFSNLHSYSPLQLADYDYFSGHFDFFSLRFIPRARVRCVSIFREPCQRLISWYRFLRAHPLIGGFVENDEIMLAHNLGPEEFFEHSIIASKTYANNAYLFIFGSALADSDTFSALNRTQGVAGTHRDSSALEAFADDNLSVAEALVRAVHRVVDLTAIGLTERFSESIDLIFASLGLPGPSSIIPHMVTDDLPKSDPSFATIPQVTMTPRLLRALRPLTQYDQIIYRAAVREFEHRRLNFPSLRQRDRWVSPCIIIKASSLSLPTSLANIREPDGVIRYDAGRHGRLIDQVLAYGPYISLMAGRYHLHLDGEVTGAFSITLTVQAGGETLYAQTVSSAEAIITFTIAAPVTGFEVVFDGTISSERLSLRQIILVRT